MPSSQTSRPNPSQGPAPTTFQGFHAVSDRAALYLAFQNDAFADMLNDRLGEHRYDVDLQKQRLSFTSDGNGQQIDTHCTLVATVAPGPKSLMWGWAHPMGKADGPAKAIEALGQKYGITDLTTAELALPAELNGAELENTVSELASGAANIGVEATSMSPSYIVDVGGGTLVVFLLDGIDLPQLTFQEFSIKIGRLLSATSIRDHRQAIGGLAERCHWSLDYEDGQFSTATLTDGHSTAQLRFDDLGRVAHLSLELTTEK